jgi:hypothetical protein
MESLTVQLETQWILHLDLAGGEHLLYPINLNYHHDSGRVCPRQHLAHSTVTLAAASVLSTFDLIRKVDESGHDIEPKRGYKHAWAVW